MTSHHSSNMQSLKLDENEKLLYKNFTIIINRQLGKGGFGQIYLGRNIKENYPIAIKVEENGTRSHLFWNMKYYKIFKAMKVFQKFINLSKDINIII